MKIKIKLTKEVYSREYDASFHFFFDTANNQIRIVRNEFGTEDHHVEVFDAKLVRYVLIES